ncbi:uncharacterized protein SCO1/SenC/PrrC, involved in biogenesis of respiratory and photosynthetic systems [Spongiibacter sp. IMCC21906]|uniref:SCO family protein n=1 Tax=Spongiibacter sp. IMCC21906 TaxID=1620392 RepID=UPI00062DF659|nr:SCO family protein [Spongiibacter sp. IMCC21906]AKH68232.1 uncharacterized protein SCO1/SenC/PrrC, involved in biogenesis of respiratory and photosynthetic systems [Spongiibacter sp. IMCC21906]
MTPRAILPALLLSLLLIAGFLLWPRHSGPPNIQGAVLATPKPLPEVQLINHEGKKTTPQNFKHRWLLIAYGFTHCADICPTLLSELAQFRKLLEQNPKYEDLQVIFYTVDPQRDSAEQLAAYVPWFDQRFIGWRAANPENAKRFEQSLGITAFIEFNDDADAPPSNQNNPLDNYQVAHGFRLYLIDPKAQLRATFSPSSDRDGSKYYEPQRLLQDYLALRRWSAG